MTRPPLFHWKETDLGRRGLCLILLYAQSKAGDKLLTSSPGDFGVNAEEMRKWVLDRLPELEADHMAKTGQPISGRKMMGRLYNMFDILPSGDRVPSSEHPTRCDNLTAVWAVMSGQQGDLFSPIPVEGKEVLAGAAGA